jgi:hypothetical protein
LAAFKFIVFLRSDCAIPIDISGPVDAALVGRAREAALESFVAASWTPSLPPSFPARLDDAVRDLSMSFGRASDLRLAFPESFDSMERLRSTYADIQAGRSKSEPPNTSLVVLGHAADMLAELM